MNLMPRLFVGGHRELRRPVNVVDETLMRRIEDARQRLRLEGKDVKPLRRASHAGLMRRRRSGEAFASAHMSNAAIDTRAAAANDPA